MMPALVLAGGEGSRLAAAGVPKPLVELGGEPLVVRLVEELTAIGCPRVTCMVRDVFADAVRERLRVAGVAGVEVDVRPCSTSSSLHTLALGLDAVEEGPVFCVMVDTLMPRDDWRRVHAAAREGLDGGAAAVLAITPFIDDEAPLYVGVDPAGRVMGLGESPQGPARVTGGAYGFASSMRRAAHDAVRAGQSRLRVFLRSLVAQGLRVTSVEVARIVDLDRPHDLAVAEQWLTEQWLTEQREQRRA
jgi:choline kinase